MFVDAQKRVGAVLKDKWTLDELVGVGGMASVYAATHRNRSRVAVKILHAPLSMNRTFRERFLREGYAANTVGHPSVVQVHDDDITEDGCAFLVMELLEGESVYDRWRRNGQHLTPSEVLAIIDGVLAALVSAHARGIVHRDLKPENLFLTQEARVKILDFGIARLREVGVQSTATQTGSAMGTPAFMPPEQALGHWDKVDARTDIWALGATMFTLLSGEYVHDATTINETLVRAATRPAPRLSAVLPGAHLALCSLVDRALAFEQSARFQSAQEMQSELARVRDLMRSDSSALSAPAQLTAPNSSGRRAGTVVLANSEEAQGVSARSLARPPTLTTDGLEFTAGREARSRRVPWLIGGGIAASLIALGTYLAFGPNERVEASTNEGTATSAGVAAIEASVHPPESGVSPGPENSSKIVADEVPAEEETPPSSPKSAAGSKPKPTRKPTPPRTSPAEPPTKKPARDPFSSRN